MKYVQENSGPENRRTMQQESKGTREQDNKVKWGGFSPHLTFSPREQGHENKRNKTTREREQQGKKQWTRKERTSEQENKGACTIAVKTGSMQGTSADDEEARGQG